jgi:peptidoglycan/LPS O-acetylase OafA/YrhL
MKTIHHVLDNKNNFDAIRLLAAIGVIFSHAYPATQGSNKREFLYVLSGGQSTLGDMCVAVFFVISGFLITRSFLRSESIVEYFTNRVLRIVPGLFAVTLAVCLILGPIVTRSSSSDYWSDYKTARYLANAFIYPGPAQELPGVFASNIYPFIINSSIWTLSYEFTCYILVAAICLAVRRTWFLSLLMLGIATATIFFTYISPRIFVSFASYFLAGAVAYAARKWIVLDIRIFTLSIGLLCLSIALQRGLFPVFCVFGTYAILYTAYARHAGRYDIARYGDFSYGVYLCGWPIQQVVAPYSMSPLLNFLISFPIVLVLVLAIFSWKIIEKPSLSMKRELATFINSRLASMKYQLSRY